MKTLMSQQVKEVYELTDKSNRLMVQVQISWAASQVRLEFRIVLSLFPTNKRSMAKGQF